ncbi:MAG: tripartite tricarboxylate transporter substrate binding protein [Burkholderiaceae bacterium]|nr:tripartite tricarboxylate transporter substrate binding protein [Burkholderiaceae bacterium]
MKLLFVLLMGCLSLHATNAAAQAYPTGVVKIIAPNPPGSANDNVARIVAEELSRSSGASFVVENRPGGQGIIATEAVKRAPADGYTLLITSISNVQAPFLIKNLSYDPVADFTPIARLAVFQWLFVANPDLGLKSMADLVDAAKAAPRKLSFAYGAPSAQAGVTEFNKLVGIEVVGIAYKGQPPALPDLIAGRTHYMLIDVNVSAPLIKSGKLKGLAVTDTRRSPLLPDVPTMAEAGIPAFHFVGWTGISAPANTPPRIVEWLSTQVVAALNRPHVVEKLNAMGITPAPLPADQYKSLIQQELPVWERRIKGAGLVPE